MDMNEYCVQMMAQQRLDDLRAAANARALRATARPSTPVRIRLGRALVRLGNRLLDEFTPARAAA